MKTKLFIYAAAAFLCCCCTVKPDVIPDSGGDGDDPLPDKKEYNAFSFIQLSDPQLGFISGQTLDFTADSLLLERMVAQVNRLKPAFVLVTGDMTNTSKQKDQISCFKKIIDKVDKSIPVYEVPGNHDIGSGSTNEKVDAYKENYGADRFYFQHEDVAFIGINSPIIKDWNKELEFEQFDWIMQRLMDSEKARIRFVVSHYPFFLKDYFEAEDTKNLSQEARDKYWPVFKRRKVSCVIAGHLHYNMMSSYNGIDMITMGPVGKPLGSGYSGATVWSISAQGKYKYTYLSVDEFETLESL